MNILDISLKVFLMMYSCVVYGHSWWMMRQIRACGHSWKKVMHGSNSSMLLIYGVACVDFFEEL